MKMTFRWYGPSDPVTLNNIRQIPGMTGIVTAIYNKEVGSVWDEEDVIALKNEINSYNLEMEVIESVPVSEDIKLRRGNYEQHIENFKENIRILARNGVKVICYNFMPVFDWTRSQLDYPLPDGSNALVYFKDQVAKLDPKKLALPGWDQSYKAEEISELIDAYVELKEEGLWSNLKYFLDEIIPVAVENDMLMAIHPDDPPWPIFNIPRIITSEANLDRFLKLYDVKNNGLTLCSGSLGCTKDNDIVAMIDKYAAMDRIHFAHIRNVLIHDDGSFEESAHYSPCGSIDMVDLVNAYHKNNFTKYIRPDHGRMIWGETGKPGYGLYDRALGAMYITGIWETLDKNKNK